MLGVSMRLPEPVDLAAPLRSYIQSNYSHEELQTVTAAIATTASLRTRVHQSIIRNESDSDQTIQLYLTYYSNLLSLQQHFPFGNTPSASSTLSSLNPFTQPKQSTVKVCFTWYDSFRHTSKVSDYDITFELNSVLFDTAALYSRRATAIKGQASAQDDTPIKEACRLFQLSAGLFEHLARSASSTASSGLSVDLSSDGLSFLNRLMLAQAQACLTGDHMVLTRSGWRSLVAIHGEFDDARVNGAALPVIEVYSFNRSTCDMQWKRVTATQRFHAGRHRLFRIQGEGIDVVATEDHDMVTGHKRGKFVASAGFAVESVGELAKRQYGKATKRTRFQYSATRVVVRCGLNRQLHYELTIAGIERVCKRWWQRDQQRDFLRFLGIWLADGSVETTDGYVQVSQRELAATAWLVDLLDAVFPHWWRRNVKDADAGGITFCYTIHCPPLYEWLRVMAAGPEGYNPLDPVQLRKYPHFQRDVEVERQEAESRYRRPRHTQDWWTESEMLAAMSAGTVRRPCCVCADASGLRLTCSGEHCKRVDDITRAHPACVGREQKEAFEVVQRVGKQNKSVPVPWFCPHPQCQQEAAEWSAAHLDLATSTATTSPQTSEEEDEEEAAEEDESEDADSEAEVIPGPMTTRYGRVFSAPARLVLNAAEECEDDESHTPVSRTESGRRSSASLYSASPLERRASVSSAGSSRRRAASDAVDLNAVQRSGRRSILASSDGGELDADVQAVALSSDRAVSDADKATADQLKTDGNSFVTADQYSQAIAKYAAAITPNPHSAIYFANRAAAYLAVGQYEKAESDCRACIAIDSHCAKAHYRMGVSLLRLGRFSEAVSAFEVALTLTGASEREVIQEQLTAARAAAVSGKEQQQEQEVEAEATPVTAVAGAQIVAAGVVWNGGGWDIDEDGTWFYRKRWMGADVANTFANLSQAQAVALLEGFCRADGTWSHLEFDKGEPAGCWQCSNPSFPLIDHLQLIGQLAGARVDLARKVMKGKTSSGFEDRKVEAKVDHWVLSFNFNKVFGAEKVYLAKLPRPLDVTTNTDNVRGYYGYPDDGFVYDLTVADNHNFLTQRLSMKRHCGARGANKPGEDVRAHPVFVGNCFFEKSTYTASPKLVAKLAQGVSELFGDCRRLAGSGRMKVLSSGGGSSGGGGSGDVYAWESHCYYQQLCYNAAAHYWLAKGLLADDKYGDEIAHLDKARQLLEAAIKVESLLLKNLAENRMKLDSAIRNRLIAAMKDNDTIYYATIPRPDTLRDPDSVVTVKSTPFVLEDAVDPYSDLLSPLVKQQSEEFRTKLSELVARLGRESRESDDFSKQILSSLGLPAALEADEGGDKGISDELWGQVHEIQFKGGKDGLEAATERIDIAVREAKSAVASIEEELNKEKSEDETMRRQFGTRWNRRSSEQLTAQFKRDVDIIKKYLNEADKSNVKVRSELERNSAVLDALRQSRGQIDARLPHNTLVSAQSSAAKRESGQQLHSLLDQLSALVDERGKVMSELTGASKKHDIAAVISQNIGKSKSVDVIYAEELGRYDTYKERLTALNGKQDALLASITSTANVYSSSLQRENSTSTVQRQSVLQQLNDGIRLYEKLLANLNEGLRFYSDLQGQRVQPLRQRVEDFCVARGMEKSLVLEQITSDIASYRGGDDGGGRGGGAMQRNGAIGGSGAYAANPNLSYEQPDHPMYDFSAVASNLPSPPPSAAAAPTSSNPFAEYQSAPPASASSYQSSLPSPYAPRPLSGTAASPHSYQSHPAASSHQPSQYQQQQQQLPSASRPSPPPPSAGGYPGQYSANPSAARPSPPPSSMSRPPSTAAANVVSCPACTFENPAGAVTCEMCNNFLPPPSAQPEPTAAPTSGQRGSGIFGLFGR